MSTALARMEPCGALEPRARHDPTAQLGQSQAASSMALSHGVAKPSMLRPWHCAPSSGTMYGFSSPEVSRFRTEARENSLGPTVGRRTVDLAAYPDLVVIYLGMREDLGGPEDPVRFRAPHRRRREIESGRPSAARGPGLLAHPSPRWNAPVLARLRVAGALGAVGAASEVVAGIRARLGRHRVLARGVLHARRHGPCTSTSTCRPASRSSPRCCRRAAPCSPRGGGSGSRRAEVAAPVREEALYADAPQDHR